MTYYDGQGYQIQNNMQNPHAMQLQYGIAGAPQTTTASQAVNRFGGYVNGLGTFSPSNQHNQPLALTNTGLGSPLNV